MQILKDQNAGLRQSEVIENNDDHADATLPARFWPELRTRLIELRTRMIVVCEGESGWDDYLLLYHFDASQALDDFGRSVLANESVAPSLDADLTDTEVRRFVVQLFIIHPTMEPSEITDALGLKPKITQDVGMQRTTPVGTTLTGTYRDTRWRHSRRFEIPGQWFADKVTELALEIEGHGVFFEKLSSTGGEGEVIITLLGGGYFGDTLPPDTLARLAALHLGVGIEC